jgi:hypothetical protein
MKLLPRGFTVALLFLAAMSAQAVARPSILAMRVPDNAITIDGRDTDWQQAGAALAKYTYTMNEAKQLGSANTDRGAYQGPQDMSFDVRLAADGSNLYILADIHDQLLFNDAGKDDIYNGDDVEVYVDANPPDKQFAKDKNDNVHQFIFIPAYMNPGFPDGLIWQADQYPGVQMASRLHPWGHTIKIKIPKALFPQWKEHPEQNVIGFDFQVNDADSPGLDGPHSSIKYWAYLLTPAPHFQSPEALSTLSIEAQPVAMGKASDASAKKIAADELIAMLKTATVQNADTLAQQVFDRIGDERAGEIAAAALACQPKALKKAGLYFYAKRPALAAPVEVLQAMLEPKVGDGDEFGDPELISYAMVALAERGKLPAKRWFGFYTRLADPQVRLTFVWCLGANGNKEIVPDLTKLLFDGNLRIRIKAVMALVRLGDPAAIPALEEVAVNDPHHYVRGEAENAVKTLKQGIKPSVGPSGK